MPSLLSLVALTVSVSSSWSAADSVRYAQFKEAAGTSSGAERLTSLEGAAKLYGGDGDVWWQLAQARLQAKQYDPAIAAYNRALELGAFGNKFRAGALYDLACAYALKGDKEQSFTFLRKSLDAGFRDLAHVRTDTDLTALHSDKRWEDLAATKDVAKMSRNDGWRYDLWLLDREVRRIHLTPYARFTAAEQDAWVKKLNRDIPKLSDNEIRVAFMKYMRRIGDGHTGIRPAEQFPTLPLQLYWFEEGLFVTGADPKYGDLAGAQVLAVGGRPVAELMKVLEDVVSRDNSQGLLSAGARLLTMPAFLNGLGVQKSDKTETLTVRDAKGATRDVTVNAEPPNPTQVNWVYVRDTSPEGSPLYLKDRQSQFWFQPVLEMKAVYLQYNAVANRPDQTTTQLAQRLTEAIEQGDVERLIVDVRWNGGGNSFLNLPIVNAIIGCRKINQPGRLFIITGRQTFSAAQNFSTDLGRALRPVFVGEPTGSSPNFVGESVRFNLPYGKMTGTISDLFWQRSWPMDARTWIAPDLPAAPSFEAFKRNVDPAMEAIRTYLKV